MTDERITPESFEFGSLNTETISSAYLDRLAEEFVGYVIDEAEQTFPSESFDIDTVGECAHLLEREGHRVNGANGEPNAFGFVPPELMNDLRESVSEWYHEPGASERGTNVYGIRFYADGSVPEDTAIVVHEEAAIPNRLSSSERPWLVRHPTGVVVVEVLE